MDDVIIIGAGLAGLTCAITLQEQGITPVVLEAGDGVGGRVRTDEVDGFLLDRGFQVYLSSYPTAGSILDLEALELEAFEPGALIWKNGAMHRLMDVWRRPQSAVSAAFAPVGSPFDKARVALLRKRVTHSAIEEIWNRKEKPTIDFLRELEFSEAMIDGFFRPFYGGIFLERKLQTSRRMLEFTFKMFAEGSATLPRNGMQAIPEQLAARLPSGTVRLKQRATAVTANSVTLASGTKLSAEHVVVATEGDTARKLLGEGVSEPSWQSVAAIYFDAPTSPLEEPILALNGGRSRVVNNVCVPSDLHSSYAPPGRALISASILSPQNFKDLEARVRAELRIWFGSQVDNWRHLKTYTIPHALPSPSPASQFPKEALTKHPSGAFVAGDHLATASIEGAMISGMEAAKALSEASKALT